MHVVLAEDSLVSRKFLRRHLEHWGYQVTATADGREAWEALQRTGARILIADWEMPEMDGLELCRTLRAAELPDYVYTILLTSRARVDDVVSGLEAGADDYVSKPFHPAELRARLRVGERVVQLESELQGSRRQLERLATTDPLTGLPNRRRIMAELERLASDRRGPGAGVIVIDVDHFKQVNDTWGHQAGDRVLVDVGERLRAALRPGDQLGRIGGEEFLVLLPSTGSADTALVAERLRAALAGAPVRLADGTDLSVTASLGTAAAGAGRSADDAYARADKALYQAKESGRNRVCCDDAGPAAAA